MKPENKLKEETHCKEASHTKKFHIYDSLHMKVQNREIYRHRK